MSRRTRYAMHLAVWLSLASPLAAQPGIDLHDYWDQRCQSCHGHAGDFVRRTLDWVDGHLAGAHHRDDLEHFLRQHYLADDLVRPVMSMLAAQLATDPLYQRRCASCHGRAADFARQSLTLRDGVPTGQSSGRAVAVTLRTHGGLSPDEAAAMVQTLRRVLGEISAVPAR